MTSAESLLFEVLDNLRASPSGDDWIIPDFVVERIRIWNAPDEAPASVRTFKDSEASGIETGTTPAGPPDDAQAGSGFAGSDGRKPSPPAEARESRGATPQRPSEAVIESPAVAPEYAERSWRAAEREREVWRLRQQIKALGGDPGPWANPRPGQAVISVPALPINEEDQRTVDRHMAENTPKGTPMKRKLEPRPTQAVVESPLPEWLWIGRVVRCAYAAPDAFEGEGAIVRHGPTDVLVRPYDGSAERWYVPSYLTPSGSGHRPDPCPTKATAPRGLTLWGVAKAASELHNALGFLHYATHSPAEQEGPLERVVQAEEALGEQLEALRSEVDSGPPVVAEKDWPAKARVTLDLVNSADDEAGRLRVLEKALRWSARTNPCTDYARPELLRMAGTYSGLWVASDEDRVGTYWYVRGPLRGDCETAKADLRSLFAACPETATPRQGHE